MSAERTPDMAPGDHAPAGTPNTGENLCHDCGGTGKRGDADCTTCGGTGIVIEAMGGP